jgi:hypothetical protein
MNNKFVIAFIFSMMLMISTIKSYADSPITSTDISDAYLDIEMVKKAKSEGIINLEIANFLSAPTNPIDIKAAVINALSWQVGGKTNADLFSRFLYNKSVKDLNLDLLNGDEIFCLGYLLIMDDYSHPEKAIPLLQKAKKKIDNSFTVSIILALAEAQEVMDSDWCEAWKKTEEIIRSEQLKQDLRSQARKIILDYMSGYQDSCKASLKDESRLNLTSETPTEAALSVSVHNETGYDLTEVKYVKEMGNAKSLVGKTRRLPNGGFHIFSLKKEGVYRVYASFIMSGKKIYAKGNANNLQAGGRYTLTLMKVVVSQSGSSLNFIDQREFDAIK